MSKIFSFLFHSLSASSFLFCLNCFSFSSSSRSHLSACVSHMTKVVSINTSNGKKLKYLICLHCCVCTHRANGLKCIKLCLTLSLSYFPIFFPHFNFFFHLDNPSTLLYPACVCMPHRYICLKTIVVTKAILLSCYNVFCEYLFVICSLYLLCRGIKWNGQCTLCVWRWKMYS